MQTATIAGTTSEFRTGVQAGTSIAIGYMPVALTFGLLAKTTGLTIGEAFLMSLVVFAGASQYIALSLLASGVGIGVIIFNTFIVNIRHFLMSASLSEKMEKDATWKKVVYAFGITDETFTVIATREGRSTAAYAFGVIVMAYGSWVIFSVAGHLVGSSLPAFLQVAMSVALYAMFVGLLVPSMKKSVKVLYLAGIAASIHTVLRVFDLLSTGWAIVAATLIASVLVEIVVVMRKGAGEK